MRRFKFTWRETNDSSKVLRVAYHNAANGSAALLKARRQMYVLGFDPYNHAYDFEEIFEQKEVDVKKKDAIIDSSQKQSGFWWDDKEEF